MSTLWSQAGEMSQKRKSFNTLKPVKIVSNTNESRNVNCSEYYLLLVLENFKTFFGFDRLCWWKMHSQGIDVLSTYPEKWVNFYLENNYLNKDKIINQSQTQMKPFLWKSEEECVSSDQKELMSHATRHGLCSGITFPLEYEDTQTTAISFSSSKSKQELEKRLHPRENDLFLLSHLFSALLKAHKAGLDSLAETEEVFAYYTEHLRH